jgi:hypothetical protein
VGFFFFFFSLSEVAACNWGAKNPPFTHRSKGSYSLFYVPILVKPISNPYKALSLHISIKTLVSTRG